MGNQTSPETGNDDTCSFRLQQCLREVRFLFVLFAVANIAAAAEYAAPANSAAGVKYVGSKVCASCHPVIYRSFSKTAMGRSASMVPGPEVPAAAKPVRVYDPGLQRYFEVFTKGPDLYQSEYALAADGSERFRTTQKLIYQIGASENGDTYVVQRGDRLFEAPLTYYVLAHKWDLSPGYQNLDMGFSRPIAPTCSSCHIGKATPVTDAPEGTYRQPPFEELSISCERCHGPGELHVNAKSSGKPATDPLIVNPAKLRGWLADNICMDCHENGASRIPQPGKSIEDFRPGTPLDNTVAVFADFNAAPPGGDTVQVLSHYEGMIASACFRKSRKMNCITCHDPHNQPAVPIDYRPKCLTCHSTASCTAPFKIRQATTPADNCLQCHMPKKPTTTIAHSALTDHRIIRQQGEPMPEIVDDFSRETGLVHLTAIPGQDTVSTEMAFRALTEARVQDPSFNQHWGDLLQRIMQDGTNDPFVLAEAGSLLLERHASQDDLTAGIKFLQVAAGDKVKIQGVYTLLASALTQSGDVSGAEAALNTGIAVDPTNTAAFRELIQVYAANGQIDQAVQTGDKYLEDFPQDTQVRTLLRQLASKRQP